MKHLLYWILLNLEIFIYNFTTKRISDTNLEIAPCAATPVQSDINYDWRSPQTSDTITFLDYLLSYCISNY